LGVPPHPLSPSVTADHATHRADASLSPRCDSARTTLVDDDQHRDHARVDVSTHVVMLGSGQVPVPDRCSHPASAHRTGGCVDTLPCAWPTARRIPARPRCPVPDQPGPHTRGTCLRQSAQGSRTSDRPASPGASGPDHAARCGTARRARARVAYSALATSSGRTFGRP
jgi:hypothetical protein